MYVVIEKYLVCLVLVYCKRCDVIINLIYDFFLLYWLVVILMNMRFNFLIIYKLFFF